MASTFDTLRPLTAEERALAADYIGLAIERAKPYIRNHCELKADLVEAASFGLIEAISRYDEAKGVKLATWINFIVKSRLRDVVVSHQQLHESERPKRRRTETSLSPKEEGWASVISGSAPSLEPPRLAELAEARELINGWLTDEQRELLRLRYELGMTFEEIGRILGVKRAAVSQRIKRLIAEVAAHLERLSEAPC